MFHRNMTRERKKYEIEDRDPFGRLMPKPSADTEISNLGDLGALGQSVGVQGKNQRPDVAKAETMLGKAGALDLKKTDGPTGYWGMRTEDATKRFQKQQGLKVDGQMNPGGETIRKLTEVTGLSGNTPRQTAQVKPTATDPKAGDVSAPAAKPGQARVNALFEKAKALTADNAASNQRTADGLNNRKGIGDMHRFTSDAINTAGDQGIVDVADIIKRVRSSDPAQADELQRQTAKGIAPENIALLALLSADDAGGDNPQPADANLTPTADTKDVPPLVDDAKLPNGPEVAGAPLVLPWLLGGAAATAAGVEIMRQNPPRMDLPPDLPDREEFPASGADGSAPDTKLPPSLPADPDASTNPPPSVSAPNSDDMATQPYPDQSDDPDINGAQVLDYKPLPEPIDFGSGGTPPKATQNALDEYEPATRQLILEAGFSDGVATHANSKGINIEVDRPESRLDDDWRATVGKFGGNPDSPNVEVTDDGRKIHKGEDGIIILQRPSGGNGMTLEIQLPRKGGKEDKYKIKRRYTKE
tara:strand:- start:6931 stop:8520 length:1590 start_codon:yes stop_codon:yes gene_type:complete